MFFIRKIWRLFIVFYIWILQIYIYLHFVFPTGIPKIKVPHISSCWKTFMHWPQNFKLYTVDTFCYSLSLEQFHVSADRLTMNKERGHHCQLICFIYYDYDVYSSIINPKKINLDNYATYSSSMLFVETLQLDESKRYKIPWKGN